MRTIRTKVYKFDELTHEIKSKIMEKQYDINVTDEWWESIYEDAANIGLKITSFDIDRASYCNGEFTIAANEVVANILMEHGEQCETYKTAQSFMDEWQPIFNNYLDETHANYESTESESTMIEMEDEFTKSLCEDYRIILSNEYDYLTSIKAIEETIISNEYEFTKDGKMI